jgi:iron complex transport system ATP-binding protein
MNYGAAAVLAGVTAEIRAGEFTAVVGPNGAGKSTLLGVLAGLKPGYAGLARYGGREIRAWRRKEFAREVSFLPQAVSVEFPFTAEQVVLMGRTPHGDGWFESDEDHAAVRRAMEATDSADYRCRDFRSLSGGERQRVLLASALAQRPRALLLDEPATYLDLKHQIDLYALLRRLAREGLLVVAVTHDLNLAAHYADRVLMLHRGTLAGDGAPRDVITDAALKNVFSVTAAIRPVVDYGD